MRHIDVAHQAEYQGKATGDQKVQTAQCDAIEQRVQEYFLATNQIDQPLRPDRKNHPDKDRNDECDDAGPHGVSTGE